MNAQALIAAASAALVFGFAAAQDARDNGERPPRPDNASNAAIGGWCDALIGPDKERCLRQGGKVEVDTKSTRGHSGGS
jgi:hypothetical protein